MTLEYQGGAELLPDGLASLNLLGLNNVFLSLDNVGAPVVNLGNGQADLLRLTATDLLQLPTQADGTQLIKVLGDSSDAISLDQLTANGQPGTWSQTGSVTQEGQLFNVYQNSADPHLQVLIDQHIVQSNVQVG